MSHAGSASASLNTAFAVYHLTSKGLLSCKHDAYLHLSDFACLITRTKNTGPSLHYCIDGPVRLGLCWLLTLNSL